MKDVGPDLRQLIDSARAGDTPTTADRERVRSALAAALVSSGGPAAPAAGPGARGWLARIGLAVLLGGALIGGGWWFVSRGTRDWRGDGKQQVVAMPEPGTDGHGIIVIMQSARNDGRLADRRGQAPDG